MYHGPTDQPPLADARLHTADPKLRRARRLGGGASRPQRAAERLQLDRVAEASARAVGFDVPGTGEVRTNGDRCMWRPPAEGLGATDWSETID